jgi:hypothetical protein
VSLETHGLSTRPTSHRAVPLEKARTGPTVAGRADRASRIGARPCRRTESHQRVKPEGMLRWDLLVNPRVFRCCRDCLSCSAGQPRVRNEGASVRHDGRNGEHLNADGAAPATLRRFRNREVQFGSPGRRQPFGILWGFRFGVPGGTIGGSPLKRLARRRTVRRAGATAEDGSEEKVTRRNDPVHGPFTPAGLFLKAAILPARILPSGSWFCQRNART